MECFHCCSYCEGKGLLLLKSVGQSKQAKIQNYKSLWLLCAHKHTIKKPFKYKCAYLKNLQMCNVIFKMSNWIISDKYMNIYKFFKCLDNFSNKTDFFILKWIKINIFFKYNYCNIWEFYDYNYVLSNQKYVFSSNLVNFLFFFCNFKKVIWSIDIATCYVLHVL